jgi:putative endopeptidase
MRQLLIVLSATTALAVAATSVQSSAQTRPAAKAAAPAKTGKPQLGTFGFDTAGMNRAVPAGENFYEFANGQWAKSTPIPADRSNYGMFTMLEELSNQRTRQILDEQAKKPGSKIGDFYSSFMNRARVNALGTKPLSPALATIRDARSKSDLASAMGKLSRMGVNAPFGNFVSSDDKDPDTSIFQLAQGGIGLPDRDYYLSDDAALVSKRTAYRDYLAQLLKLSGERDAEARAGAVLALETRIAQAHWTQVESRDADKTYNKLTRADLVKSAPTFPWTNYLEALGVGGQQSFLVRQPSALAGSAAALDTTPMPVLKDYLMVRTLDAYAPYLSDALVAAHFKFHGTTLGGTPENQALWKRGANLVTNAMGEDIGRIYVDRYFPPEAKAQADALVKNVIAAMDRRIQNLTWMAPETKTRARAKLAAFTPKIGYPERWRDYGTLQIRRDDLAGNVMRANEFEHQRQLNKLGQPVDRGEWGMYPMTINAYANFNWNEIVFPAAILQPPFFDPNADPAVNYGGIGAVIGHEISHHFDDQGSKYDETGALKEWWTKGDLERFNALTGRLVQQYGQYEPLPGKKVSGELTLGENIGDLAGVTIAYDAYRTSLGGREAPVIGGFTGDQRFYLGWAQVWRRNYREPNLLQRLITDPHSPSEQRVAVVRNMDPWYAAFNPQPGQKLYLAPAERVRIW